MSTEFRFPQGHKILCGHNMTTLKESKNGEAAGGKNYCGRGGNLSQNGAAGTNIPKTSSASVALTDGMFKLSTPTDIK